MALPLGLTLLASGCSGDDRAPAPTPSDVESTAAAVEAPLTTTSRIGKVVGGLSQRRQDHLASRITTVVDAWWDSAYVGEELATTDAGAGAGAEVFPGFTPGATARAEADSALMSNAEVGAGVESVSATKRRLRIDVLAVDDRPVGVTARFTLGMRFVGEQERDDTVSGTLFLSYQAGSWQVFGYDVSRGTV